MDDILQGAKSLLDSVYPEISSLSTVSIPTTVVIDGSTYRIPAIAFPTPSTTSSSISSSSPSSATSTTSSTSSSASTTSSRPSTTSAPAQTSIDLNRTPTTTPAAPPPSDGHDRRLGIILGVVLSLLAILIAAAVMWYAWRRKKRTGYWLKHKPPPSDEEVDTWRASDNGVKEKPTSSFFVRPLNHTSHIWSDHGSANRYQPLTNAAPQMATAGSVKPGSAVKGDPFADAAGLSGGMGATRVSEREVNPDGSSAPLVAGDSDDTLASPTADDSPHPLSSHPNPFASSTPPRSSPLSQPPINAPAPSPPPMMPDGVEQGGHHTASRTAAAAGLGGLAGLAAARHARKSSSHSRSRSRGVHPRRSDDHPAHRRSIDGLSELPAHEELEREHSSSDSYHTPPEGDLAAEMTVNDGPYARARRASWGEKRMSWKRRSAEQDLGEVSWRQSRDMEYTPVPDPYSGGARRSWPDRTTVPDGASGVQNATREDHERRPPTPLMHAMFGGNEKGKEAQPALVGAAPEEQRGRSDTVGSKRSTISRKPVPAPIQTKDLDNKPPVQTRDRYSNPFVSPDDDYSEHSSGPYGGSPVYARRRSSGYARGDYEEDYGPAPLLPQRSPQRRYSPQIHYPSGPEVSQFDFGLTKEELRGLREAGERRSVATSDGERTWSFERGHGV